MGLMMPALRYLAREHRRQPFAGRVLTLGRQCVYATLTDVREMLRAEGLDPRPLRSEADRFSNIPGWSDGARAQYTSDRAFWAALAGVKVETLDVSDYEHAEHLADLNRPIPDALVGQFDVVLDGGTLEHVFDTAQAVRNLVSLLRVGGRMLHMSPGSNDFEHGFYQFSPTFFFDYYGANGFADLACSVAEIPSGSDWARTDLAFRDCNPARPVETVSPHYQLVMFRATKVAGSTADRVPRQGDDRSALRQAAKQREQADTINDRFTPVWPELSREADPVAVYGAGEVGRIVASRARAYGARVECLVDRKPELWNTRLDGIEVVSLPVARARGLRTFVVGSLGSGSEIAAAIRIEYADDQDGVHIYAVSDTGTAQGIRGEAGR